MKKFLAFLFLFASGLAVVAWFDWRTDEAVKRAAIEPNRTSRELTPVPYGAEPGIHLGGRFEADLYDETTGNIVLRIKSDASQTVDDADELQGVTVVVMDPSAAESIQLGSIDATDARLPRRDLGALRPTHMNQVFLTGVTGHFDRGLPLAPLDFTTSSAKIDASVSTHFVLEGDVPIRIASPEFDAGGDSYRIDIVRPSVGGERDDGRDDSFELDDAVAGTRGREEVIHLREKGWLDFRRDATESGAVQSARLEAIGDGTIQIRRSGDAEPRPVFFEVDGRGRLELRGEEASTLEGDHLLLRGSVRESSEVIQPERLDLTGNVLWSSARSVFTADECGIDFVAGEFTHALLTGGLPTLRVALDIEPDRIEDLPTALKLEDDAVRLVSNEAIELSRRNDALYYRVAGPATLETAGVHLRSNGELTGFATDAGDQLSFAGDGGVVIEAMNGTLQAAGFELSIMIDEENVQTLRGIASGGARLVGTAEDGRGFTVTTPDRLIFERIGDRLRIVEGFGVEMSVDGTDGFFARCDHLADLRIAERSFYAEGNVVFRTEGDEALCDRLESRGPRRYTMWGNAESRAVFVSAAGRAEAMFVELDNDRLHAHGNVEATIESLPGDGVSEQPSPLSSNLRGVAIEVFDLACEDLLVVRTKEKRDDDSIVRVLHLEATEGVSMKVGAEGKTVVLRRAESVIADRTDHFADARPKARRLAATTALVATGDVEAHLTLGQRERVGDIDVLCDSLAVSHSVNANDPPERSMLASGNVRFAGTGEIEFRGEGDSLRVDPDETAHLEALDSEQIRLYGLLPTHDLPFELTATRADFTSDRIEAIEPDISVTELRARDDTVQAKTIYRARARRMIASTRSLELIHDVRFTGSTKAGVPWALDARRVVLEGRGDDTGNPTELSRISATGGITFNLGERIIAKAQALFGVGPSGVLRLSGSPTTIETPTTRLTADWIDFDPELQIILESGKGRIEGSKGMRGAGAQSGSGAEPGTGQSSPADGWTLDYLWSTTRLDQDSLVFFLQEPTFRHPGNNSMLRASWSVLWIDRHRWEQLADGELPAPVEPPIQQDDTPLGPMRVFFDFIEQNDAAGLVREAYFEGPVQVFLGEEEIAHADAIYFDLTSGHGWLNEATINLFGNAIGKDGEKLTVRTNWLRHSADGSLRADNATVTTCGFDDPHVTIATGDLRLTPLSNDIDGGYHVSMRDNRIEMYDTVRIPLPPIEFDTDDELKPVFPSLSFGDTARFGQLFGFRFSGQARSIGSFFNRLFSFGSDDDEAPEKVDPEAEPAPRLSKKEKRKRKREKRKNRKKKPYDARYDVDAKYLGSRGALFDFGFTYRSSDRYWFEFLTGVVFDGGEDRGFLRVPESERDRERLWLRSFASIDLNDPPAPNAPPVRRGDHRILFTLSDASDPGVEAEFFESDFVRWERDETYLQWKRASGNLWAQASVSTRVDEFRAAVEELPAVTGFRGRAPIAHLGRTPIIHTGDLRAGYLRRRNPSTFDLDGDGLDDSTLTGPFAPSGVYPDGAFNREVVRVDSVQTLEAPISLGVSGVKFTPFVDVRGTTWSEASDQSNATRVVAQGGARLATTLWRRRSSGWVDQIAPYVQYRAELESDFDGTPFVFDATETVLFGDFIDLGTRARFGVRDGRTQLDLDLRGVYASNRSDGADDGWLPIALLGRAGQKRGERLLDVWYDGRFDTDAGEFTYSLFSLGTRFQDRGGLQISHHYGRDESLVKIFDAATVAGFYRWTEKWEFEARQSFSILEDSRLDTSIVLRRYGHDVVFEVETEVREGEGSSINFSVRPRLGFRPSRIGFINW